MKVELTDISAVKKRLDIEIPQDVVSEEITNIAREFAKRARVPGFRPGRAPLGVVRNRYRDDIVAEMYQHLLPKYFSDAVQEKSLEVVGASTTFEPPEYSSGQALSFQVGFEVFPAIEIDNYSDIPVEEVPTEITDDEIDKYFDQMLEERAEMTPVDEDRALQAGDFAEITFSGSLVGGAGDGQHEDLSGEKALCEIGGPTTVKEFTENLSGARVGEERRFDVVYRDDHPEKRLAGKTASYTVRIEGIKTKTRPTLDDEFAQAVGDYQTVADLRSEVRRNMEQHRKGHAEQQMRDAILGWLEDNNDFEVPDSLVEQQLQTRMQRLMRNLTQQGMNPRQLDIDWGRIRSDQYEQAVRDVRGLLILEHVAEKEHIAVTDDDVENEVQEMAGQMGQTPTGVRQALEQNDGLDRLWGQIRNNKILSLLQSKARIVPAGSLKTPDDDGQEPSLSPGAIEP
jgi:trigger factor